MKLGILTATLQEQPLEAALDAVLNLGAEAVSFCSGGYGGKAHCDPGALLADRDRLRAFDRAIAERALEVAGFCVYGNPLHPDRDLALAHRRDLRDSILLAGQMGVPRVVAFSGCPGDSPEARFPNWVTYPWPPEWLQLRTWQWEHHVLPFWTDTARFAAEQGVTLCLELHAGQAIYNVETLRRLRAEAGPRVAACLNPGHLWWQGMEPARVARDLAGAVACVHATDCRTDPLNAPLQGALDARSFAEERERAWSFRTVGYGHGEEAWQALLLELAVAGYDGPVVIEHEDTLLAPLEGLRASMAFLQRLVVREPLAVPSALPLL